MRFCNHHPPELAYRASLPSELPKRTDMRSHPSENESSTNPIMNSRKAHHAEMHAPALSPSVEEFESSVTVRSGTKTQPRIPEVYHIQGGATAWLVALHLGALAAPWTFSWSG